MNKDRRYRLTEAIRLLNTANKIITEVCDEEETAFDNLTDGLQQTTRGMQMEENVDTLQEVLDEIKTIIENLDDIT